MRLRLFACYLLINLFCILANAEDLFDSVYKTTNQVFRSDKCEENFANAAYSQIKSGSPCADNSPKISNLKKINGFSENVFYNRLSELELQRLQCARDQWESVSVRKKYSKNGKIVDSGNLANELSQKLRIAQINDILPDLKLIQEKLETLSQGYASQNSKTSLVTLQTARKYTKTDADRQKIDQQISANKNTNAGVEAEIQMLLNLYHLKMSQIPNSENLVVRKFIQDKLNSNVGKKLKPVTVYEFQTLNEEVVETFDKSIKEINSDKKNANYNLSIQTQDRLVSDPTLIGQIVSENPANLLQVEKYQCLAKSRMKTKEDIEMAYTVESFVVSGGAFATVKAARSAFVLKSPQLASKLEKASKTLGWSSAVLGGIDSTKAVADSCSAATKASVQGQCKMNAKQIIEEHEMSACIWETTLAALPGAAKLGSGLLAARLGNKGPLSKFIDEMKMKSRNGTYYDFAGSLSNEDRILAAEGIIGRKLSDLEKKLVIEAHEMSAFGSLGKYTAEEISAKKDLLIKNGFTKREADLLSLAGVTGKSIGEVILDVQRASKTVLQMDISPSQAKLIADIKYARGLPSEKMQILKGNGFSDDQAKRILQGDVEKFFEKNKDVIQAVSIKPPPAPTSIAAAPPATLKPLALSRTDPIIRAGESKMSFDAAEKIIKQEIPKLNPRYDQVGMPSSKANEAIRTMTDEFNLEISVIQAKTTKLESSALTASERRIIELELATAKARCRGWNALRVAMDWKNTTMVTHFENALKENCAN